MAKKPRRYLRKAGDGPLYVYNYTDRLVEKGGFVECDVKGNYLTHLTNPLTDPVDTGISRRISADRAELEALKKQMAIILDQLAVSRQANDPAPDMPAIVPVSETTNEVKEVDVTEAARLEDMTKAEIVDAANQMFGDKAEHMKEYMPRAKLLEEFGLLEAMEGVETDNPADKED